MPNRVPKKQKLHLFDYVMLGLLILGISALIIWGIVALFQK
jgi:hypothetical protein